MKLKEIVCLLLLPLVAACGNAHNSKPDPGKQVVSSQEQYPKEVFKSEGLQVQQVSPNTYVHISYLVTDDYGKVPCNGMIAVNGNKAIIFDATTTDATSAVLIRWIKEELKANPVALVVTHFHEDCLGGAGAFTQDNTVGYFAKDAVLFGGCLVKELNAEKGYLGDADTAAWPATINKLKQAYPGIKLVIPGHGAAGGKELLDYTHDLFAAKEHK
ncbi:MAG: MBL fold metallo-hydrolase [Sphingobacteriales bacterium]|nr:MAG: MBL fold metallo-hydrolase [Sphingobacteriales bacterium]